MDNVLNCLKNKRLSRSIDYKYFLEIVVTRYLLLEDYANFEDFCVEQYCERIAGLYLSDKAGTLQTRRLSCLTGKVIEQLKKKRDIRKEKEAYLQSSFEEDIRRSRSELLKIIHDMPKDNSVCSRY
jgi:hypothetical protein